MSINECLNGGVGLFIATFLLLTLSGAISIIYYTLRLGISPMPTAGLVKPELLKLLPRSVSGTVYELGAGWGTLLIPLAKRYPAQRIVAYERSWVPFLVARLRSRRYPNVSVKREDFFSSDLGDAGLVVTYLFPSCMAALSKKLEAELPSGCWMLTHTFRLPGWRPQREIICKDLYQTRVYQYRQA